MTQPTFQELLTSQEARDRVSVSMLHQVLFYDQDEGRLFWLERPVSMFKSERDQIAWNARFAFKEAFSGLTGKGYLCGRIFGVRYFAHHVVWAMNYGAWPNQIIDHIDRVKTNNRLDNLRAASKQQNCINRGCSPHSSSQYLGVHWDSRKRKWIAQIVGEARKKFLGAYVSEIDAALAYDAAAKTFHGEFANLNFPDQQKDAA